MIAQLVETLIRAAAKQAWWKDRHDRPIERALDQVMFQEPIVETRKRLREWRYSDVFDARLETIGDIDLTWDNGTNKVFRL